MKGDAERWIGIRWEFMREDPKYIEAFDRVIEIESNNTDKGILNPCQEALLARANERLKAGVSRTKDLEIQQVLNPMLFT